ncbi:helix-turn-helix domain-containing protein [Acidisoma cellulosilytica]|uniref:Helix-turn-helix domain-containing protein n=1 Tax=Acidisoma cellulosilyticum TaxID=2802395 RepID=A0A964E6M2_9PROT|nr:helix-turn-helix domain-containing protein [Acidisoma cellulosilyticum]MCB8883726.1 helix-turn-helix domain-containing protein [Acidisoma cellulosilyticum]
MQLAILVLDGVFDTGLTVLLDSFSTANELAAAQGIPFPLFNVTLVGMQKQVRTGLGLTVLVEPVSVAAYPDWVIVPALNAKGPDHLSQALSREDVKRAVAQLRLWHESGCAVAGACIGTFLLAEAGLLDGVDATTSWSLAPFFRQRYPTTRLSDVQMIAVSGNVVTAGAVMGHMDLALWLMRRSSPEIADLVARYMLDARGSFHGRHIMPDHLAHSDPLIAKFERWAREHLASGFSLQAAASALAVGPRTLQRRMESLLGKSPLAFVQDLRVERAQHLLAMGQNIERIAAEVGYADAATLRTLMRRQLGNGVRELRAVMRGLDP